jgi:hypothetical protein
MGDAGTAIVWKLNSDSNVSDLVTDITAVIEVQGVDYPRIIYVCEEMEFLSPTLTSNGGLVTQKMMLNILAHTYAEVQAIAQAVIISLDRQRGAWGSVSVLGVFFRNQSDTEEYADKQTLFYNKQLTFEVIYDVVPLSGYVTMPINDYLSETIEDYLAFEIG